MNKLDIYNLHLADFGHNLNKTRQTLSDVILQEGDGPTVIPTLAKKITSKLAEVRKRLTITYLSKRLRQQGQTEGALTNTKVSLVSILKNATLF